MKRRDFLTLAPAAGLCLSVAPVAFAKDVAQVSAIQRFTVGDVTVSALSDGYIQMNAGLFPGVDDAAFAAALIASFQDPTRYLAAVNAYVVDTGSNVYLIDAGTGAAMGPTLGQLGINLAAAGYDPADIESVILTHLHPDHVGGAVANGSAVFPNAELVASTADHSFWTDPTMKSAAPDQMQVFFDMASGAVAQYGDRLRLIGDGDEVVPGLTAMAMPGHTPGHTGYILSSGNETLMLWGDIIHMPALQFAKPEITIAFDADPDAAKATRAKVLDMVATDRLRVAGMHLSFPGVGYVEKAGGGYAFEPAAWEYL